MARPTLFTHRKFILLAAKLRSRALALGALELIWESSYASGEALIGPPEVVEMLADWRGDPGGLASVLVETGFLDARADGQLAVHDLEDHAPDYVAKRWQREAKRKMDGQSLRTLRQKAALSSHAARSHANGGQLHEKDEQTASKRPANLDTPAPAPAPAHNVSSENLTGQDPEPVQADDEIPRDQPCSAHWLQFGFDRAYLEHFGRGRMKAPDEMLFVRNWSAENLAKSTPAERATLVMDYPVAMGAFFSDSDPFVVKLHANFPYFLKNFDRWRPRHSNATGPPRAPNAPPPSRAYDPAALSRR